MSNVKEILAAAKRLPLKQFLRLQQELKRMEDRLWEAESRAAVADMKKKGVTNRDIDSIVMRRRREPDARYAPAGTSSRFKPRA